MKTHTIHPKPNHPHTHTIILLHGRDSTASEFAAELFESEASPSHLNTTYQDLTLPSLLLSIKWVFPSAPLLYSARFDTTLSQWFDIWSVEKPGEKPDIQVEGLRSSISALEGIIRVEEELISGGRGRIFLGGISQGFATVLGAVLGFEMGGSGERFAGLIGLCSWLPFAGELEEVFSEKTNGAREILEALREVYCPREIGGGDSEGIRQVGDLERGGKGDIDTGEAVKAVGVLLEAQDIFKSMPIFIGHCEDDEVVPIENGERIYRVLGECLGFTAVDFVKYKDGGHWVNEPKGVDDIVAFVRENM